jgi:hypothetical protein
VLEKILQLLWIRCRHKKTSQPFTAATAGRPAGGSEWEGVGPRKHHYVVCLECGRKFHYDWQKMRIVS